MRIPPGTPVNIPGATSATYVTDRLTYLDDGNQYIAVANLAGVSLTSSTTLTLAPSKVYTSSPAPGSSLSEFGTITSAPTIATITITNDGTDSLTVTQFGALSSSTWYSITSSLPLTITSGVTSSISVQCLPAPGDSGTQTDVLVLATDDPLQPTVSYPMECSWYGYTAIPEGTLPTISGATNEYRGQSVALTKDGLYQVVGGGGSPTGVVSVVKRTSNGSFAQVGAQFSVTSDISSVEITDEGLFVFIGTRLTATVQIYKFTGVNYTPHQTLTRAGGSNFGNSMAVCSLAPGKHILIVGAPYFFSTGIVTRGKSVRVRI